MDLDTSTKRLKFSSAKQADDEPRPGLTSLPVELLNEIFSLLGNPHRKQCTSLIRPPIPLLLRLHPEYRLSGLTRLHIFLPDGAVGKDPYVALFAHPEFLPSLSTLEIEGNDTESQEYSDETFVQFLEALQQLRTLEIAETRLRMVPVLPLLEELIVRVEQNDGPFVSGQDVLHHLSELTSLRVLKLADRNVHNARSELYTSLPYYQICRIDIRSMKKLEVVNAKLVDMSVFAGSVLAIIDALPRLRAIEGFDLIFDPRTSEPLLHPVLMNSRTFWQRICNFPNWIKVFSTPFFTLDMLFGSEDVPSVFDPDIIDGWSNRGPLSREILQELVTAIPSLCPPPDAQTATRYTEELLMLLPGDLITCDLLDVAWIASSISKIKYLRNGKPLLVQLFTVEMLSVEVLGSNVVRLSVPIFYSYCCFSAVPTNSWDSIARLLALGVCETALYRGKSILSYCLCYRPDCFEMFGSRAISLYPTMVRTAFSDAIESTFAISCPFPAIDGAAYLFLRECGVDFNLPCTHCGLPSFLLCIVKRLYNTVKTMTVVNHLEPERYFIELDVSGFWATIDTLTRHLCSVHDCCDDQGNTILHYLCGIISWYVVDGWRHWTNRMDGAIDSCVRIILRGISLDTPNALGDTPSDFLRENLDKFREWIGEINKRAEEEQKKEAEL